MQKKSGVQRGNLKKINKIICSEHNTGGVKLNTKNRVDTIWTI